MESTEEKKRERRAIAADIDELLNNVDYNPSDLVDNNTLVFQNQQREQELAENDMKLAEDASATSRELIESALSLYAHKHSGVDYVQLKSKADINTFAKILCQIEVNEEAIKLVMRDLRNGDGINSNLLRSLSDLQKTEIELWKMKAQYLALIETSLKQVSSDIDMEEGVDTESEDVDEGVARVRSNRDLMRLIGNAAESLKNKNNEEKKDEEEDSVLF